VLIALLVGIVIGSVATGTPRSSRDRSPPTRITATSPIRMQYCPPYSAELASWSSALPQAYELGASCVWCEVECDEIANAADQAAPHVQEDGPARRSVSTVDGPLEPPPGCRASRMVRKAEATRLAGQEMTLAESQATSNRRAVLA